MIVIHGTIRIYQRHDGYEEGRIYIKSRDLDKIRHLNGKEVHIIIISNGD